MNRFILAGALAILAVMPAVAADVIALPGMLVRGSGGATGTSAATIITAPPAGYKIHVTAVQCKNTGTTSTVVTLSDTASTVLIAPAGSGDNSQFWPADLSVAPGTALTFTPSAASTTIYCNAQGYVAPVN